MELRPFRALRYDDTRVDLSAVVAPPYDVIDDAHRDLLYQRSPFNVVRLILNREPDRYASSARHLGEWLSMGVLRQDDDPALWLYAQNFAYDGARFERTGIIGTVRLEPFSSGRIRPHERTLSGPKEDRMRLLEACRVNLSPIFGLYAGRCQALDQARTAAAARHSLWDLTDEFNVRHRLWRLHEPHVITAISKMLADETIFIADGHHRYETALAYRERLRARGDIGEDDPASFIMMYLCSMQDPGLLVLPTHRIMRHLPGFDPAKLLAALQRSFNVRALPQTASGRQQLLAELAAGHKTIRFGVMLKGVDVLYEISLPGTPAIDRAASELPPAVRGLDVTVLDRLILRSILGLDADSAARAGQLSYTHDSSAAFASISSGDGQIAFVLSPPDLAQVQAVCLSGETMPQKSTYFYPKLLTGLVFNPLVKRVDELQPAAWARTA
jgi:uncharacterized protein (DUF1015 family)